MISETLHCSVRKYIAGLHFNKTMKVESCFVNEVLEKLRHTITKFSPQDPKRYNSEEAKAEYLYEFTAGTE